MGEDLLAVRLTNNEWIKISCSLRSEADQWERKSRLGASMDSSSYALTKAKALRDLAAEIRAQTIRDITNV